MNYASESATGVSPLGLVIRLYETIVGDLGRAVTALRDGNIEARTNHLQHALLIIAHLHNALDMENGGEPARMLERFYNTARGQILEAQLRQSGKILEELMQDFLSVREAWAEVEKQAQPSEPTTQEPANPHPAWVA